MLRQMSFTAIVLATAIESLLGCGGQTTGSVPVRTSIAGVPEAEVVNTGRPGKPLSRASLITTADRICKRLDFELASSKPRSGALSEIARLAPARAALELKAVAQLNRLVPPTPLAGAWRQIIAYRRTLATQLAELARAAKRGDTAGVGRIGLAKQHLHEALFAKIVA